VPRVTSGEKRHTIRGVRNDRPIQVGDLLSHRYWSGVGYRSKQALIREEICTKVTPIEIDADEIKPLITIGGQLLTIDESERLAVQDGFDDLTEMMKWHREAGGLPFEGVLIEWKVT
jgi:hypothetical protein